MVRFLTVKEFSEQMSLTREQVYEWLKIGKIKGIRVSDGPKSQWRIPDTELKRLHALAYGEEDENI